MTDNLPTTKAPPDTLTLAVWAAHAAMRRNLIWNDEPLNGILWTGDLVAELRMHRGGEWYAGWSYETRGALGDSHDGYGWDEAPVAVPA